MIIVIKELQIVEIEYAKFIHDLLNSMKTPIKLGSITQASLNRAIDLGLNQGLKLDLKAVQAHANTILEGTRLTLNLESRKIFSGSLPGGRFYTMLFVLFRDASYFLEHLTIGQRKKFISEPHSELHENRSRLNNILANSNYKNTQELLNDHLELVQWLKKNDPAATSHKLTQHQLGPAQREKERTDEIESIAKRLHSEKGMPIRITAKRIEKELNCRKLGQRKKQGELTNLAKKIMEAVESTHHYYIRVILWVARTLTTRERRISTLRAITGVPTAKVQPIAEYFGWLEAGCLVSNLPRDVSELSIPITWTLPDTDSESDRFD